MCPSFPWSFWKTKEKPSKTSRIFLTLQTLKIHVKSASITCLCLSGTESAILNRELGNPNRAIPRSRRSSFRLAFLNRFSVILLQFDSLLCLSQWKSGIPPLWLLESCDSLFAILWCQGHTVLGFVRLPGRQSCSLSTVFAPATCFAFWCHVARYGCLNRMIGMGGNGWGKRGSVTASRPLAWDRQAKKYDPDWLAQGGPKLHKRHRAVMQKCTRTVRPPPPLPTSSFPPHQEYPEISHQACKTLNLISEKPRCWVRPIRRLFWYEIPVLSQVSYPNLWYIYIYAVKLLTGPRLGVFNSY